MNGFDYELAKMRIAEDHHWADQERLVREARQARHGARQAVAPAHEQKGHVGFSLKRLITRLAWT